MSQLDKYGLWIRNNLQLLDFVDWDRFVEFETDGGRVTRVYGWIEREDNYKDFVHLEFIEESSEILFLGTSSEKYSEKIDEILFEESNHVDCERVEKRFSKIKNKIQIQEEA